MLSMMGEDFVAQRQQRTGEMVRLKNLREEKILAMKIGGKRGGLEANKRYTLNKFQKERQRLVKDLQRMKLLRARPRYSDSLPDILTLDDRKEGKGNEDASKEKNTDQENTDDKVDDNTAELTLVSGLSPRQERQNLLKADNPADAEQTKTGKGVSNRKGKRKKGKLERMYEKSAEELKRAQERMSFFVDAMEDEEKWEMFRMMDGFCMEHEAPQNVQDDEGQLQNGVRGLETEGRKIRPLPMNVMNMGEIKDNIAKRLIGQATSPSPGQLGIQVPNARKSPGLLTISPDGSKSPDDNSKSPDLRALGKNDRVGRWAQQVEQAHADDLGLVAFDSKRTRKISSRMVGTLEPIMEKEAEKRPDESPPQAQQMVDAAPRVDGDWSQKTPQVEGVFIEDFEGQIVYDQELYNPDGTYRAVHTMPDFEASLEEAKKARYVRYGKDEVPEHEKDLSMSEIFGKSDQEDEIERLIKAREASEAKEGRGSQEGSDRQSGPGSPDDIVRDSKDMQLTIRNQ